jgi:hypothetical protein
MNTQAAFQWRKNVIIDQEIIMCGYNEPRVLFNLSGGTRPYGPEGGAWSRESGYTRPVFCPCWMPTQ